MTSEGEEVSLTHTKKLGNSEFEVFVKSQPQTAHLMFSIEKYLQKCPAFYYHSLLMKNKGRPIQTIEKNLKNQFDSLTKQRSFYQIMQKALTARQKCIQKIKRDLTKAERVLTMFKKQYFQPNNTHHSVYLEYVEKQGYSTVEVQQTVENSIKLISTVFIDMSRLRDMTIWVVQTIHKWKVEIEEWTDKCNQYESIFFIHREQSVYDIILQDTRFIWQSSLNEYIYIDTVNDPFMIRNVLQVQQRETKTILQKYFVELLYPKNEEIVSKSVKCSEMLTFKYEPQVKNIYREQQLLIQNYLSLKKQQQNQEGMQEIQQNQFQWEDKVKNEKKDKLNAKGWVFGKVLKKPSNEKIKDMIQRHQQKITFIKPFNISNYTQKNALALAYLSRINQSDKEKVEKVQKIFESKKQKQISKVYRTRSTHQPKRSMSLKKLSSEPEKGYRSQNDKPNLKLSKMYQSLSKLTPMILEDPQEHIDETPKYKKHKDLKALFNKNILTQNGIDGNDGKDILKNRKSNGSQNQKNQQSTTDHQSNIAPILMQKQPNLKINTFSSCELNTKISPSNQNKQATNSNKKVHQIQNLDNGTKLQVSDSQQQITLGQFLENFRPNTNKNARINEKLEKEKDKVNQKKKQLDNNQEKLVTIRQLIQAHRVKNTFSASSRKSNIFNVKHKSPYTSKSPVKTHIKKEPLSQSRTKQVVAQTNNSFSEYKQIPQEASQQTSPTQPFKFSQQFIILKSKSIPIDIIPQYLTHIFSQLHSTAKKFTLYTYTDLLQKLQDPYTQCIIFDIATEKKGTIGQVILTQTVSTSTHKLKYTIEFINVLMFEFVVGAVLRIVEQLLYATPCQVVICPFFQDKLDPVSTHFIQLIQAAFKSKVNAFGQMTILEKKRVYYQGSDMHERLYVFSSNNKKLQQVKLTKAMMGNYRSLKFQCKCLILSSNFRMRSKTSQKSVISTYHNNSLGYLYRKVLQKIMTKFHLRQIKMASTNSNENDETVSLLKKNSFLRTQILALMEYLKEEVPGDGDNIYLTRFQNMSEVLTYLDYKQYSQYFYFSFLEESRFILNHQLFLTQLQLDVSLQFMVRSSVQFLILFNHHNFPIKIIQPSLHSKAKSILLPTTNPQIQLIFIDGHQYTSQTTDKLDLFSYLYIFQQNRLGNYEESTQIKQIVIPMLHKLPNNMNTVKMFDGIYRLFPEREFYSGTYFKCHNLWETYFPSAVIYNASENTVVFDFPLIVGFVHKQRKQILTAFLLKNNHE